MSPAPTATPEKQNARVVPPQLQYPTADLLRRLAKEIVVDWQLPSDLERERPF